MRTQKRKECRMWFRQLICMFCVVTVHNLLIAEDHQCKTPHQVKVLVASFGTINSQTEVESWLSDQLRPIKNADASPELSQGDRILNPEMAAEVAYINWKDKRIQYLRTSEAARAENARRARILTNLKTQMLSDDALRYVQLGREYLQSKLYKNCGKLVSVVDRGNMTIQQTEKQLKDKSADDIASADCVLSVVMGDREKQMKKIPVDNIGTEIVRTTYVQPYVGKLRDLSGNVLMAFDGNAKIVVSGDNIVSTTESDPARRLVEAACEKIADDILGYFTTKIVFKVKVPEGMDVDDVEIRIDGKDVDALEARVLSCDHRICAELDGCAPIEKALNLSEAEGTKNVKLNFKQK